MKKKHVKFLCKSILLIILLITTKTTCPLFSQSEYTCKSPDKKINITVSLLNQKLTYSASKDGNEIISPSALGINTNIADFSNGLTFIDSSSKVINETYSLPSGKKSTFTYSCIELTLQFTKDTKEVQIIFRVFNDGFAYRYNILGSGSVSVYNETSEFAINNFEKAWGMKYGNGYSDLYPARNWDDIVTLGKLASPILVKNTIGTTWCLITEAANISTYSSSTINPGTQIGQFILSQNGSITSALPLATPWRVVIAGDLPTIVESEMIEDLNPPTTLDDLSWIKPGRASWDWGGEEGHPTVSVELAKKYIDLASSMGWEYYMQDDGWDKADFNLQDVINYATSKEIGILLWTGASRFNNDENQIRTILSGWKSKGIKGVKVDFWGDDSQTEFQKYDKIVKIAAEQKLLVNLHGCTKPSGIRRTWPNLITSEAVWGGEMYLFYNANPSDYNITLSMTRNVIGSMDYTPLDFANKSGKIKQFTTWSHQLALGIIYESGVQHMNDSPENYQFHIAKQLLKKLPAAWDETKCFEAYPEQYTTIARRKGNEWFVGSLCKNARALNLNLSFLNSGVKYYANIFKDGECDSEIAFEQKEVSQGDNLSIPMRANGGASVYFSTIPMDISYPVTKYEAESPSNTFNNVSLPQDPDGRTSNNQFVGNLGNGNSLIFNKINVPATGVYIMTLYYMAGEDRNGYIKINNEESVNYTFTSTGGYNGNGLGMRSFVINLNIGDNKIEFGNKTNWSINIDRITIQNAIVNCTPIAISPFVKANNNAWVQTDEITVKANETAIIEGRPTIGSWEWAGPENFISAKQQITLQNIQLTQSGIYNAICTNTTGCQNSLAFNVIVSGINDIKSIDEKNTLDIISYPNPSKDQITLKNVPANTIITISNLNGQIILYSKSSNEFGDVKVNISSLITGTYIIKLGNDNKIFRLVKNN